MEVKLFKVIAETDWGKNVARRERLKSALYIRINKRSCKKSVGRFREKLLFSKLRLLLTKAQYSSDITSEYYEKDLQ